jgi:hypothetical protein
MEISDIIEGSNNRLLTGISKIEREFLNFILKYVAEEFDMSGGF